MKFSILALGAAAASIFGVHCAEAQFQIQSQSSPQTIRQVSQSEDDFGLFNQKQDSAPNTDDSSILSEAQPIAELSASDSIAPESPSQNSPEKSVPVSTNNPVELHKGETKPQQIIKAPLTPMAPMASLAVTPEVGMVPVFWPQGMGGCATPNPVAAIMARNWCTQGLWDSYACERALQCQAIQKQLNGSHCGHGHCGHGHCGHGHVVNRYTAASGCASCAAGCDSAGVNQLSSTAPTSPSPSPVTPASAGSYVPSNPSTSTPPLPMVDGGVGSSILLPHDVPTVPSNAIPKKEVTVRPIVPTPVLPAVTPLPQPPAVVAGRPVVSLR